RLRPLAEHVAAVASSAELDAKVREQAIAVMVRLQGPAATGVLRQLLDDREPRVARAALRALVDVQDMHTLREVLCGEKHPSDIRHWCARRLVDSTAGALVLLRLIDENKLPHDLKRQVLARAVAHPDSNVRVLYEKFVPEDKRPKKLGQQVAADDIL